MTEPKRRGPKMHPIAWTCLGCEFHVTMWVWYMGHKLPKRSCCEPTVLVDGNPKVCDQMCGGFKTPDWCPLLPLRRVVGQCLDCKHAEFDGDIANCSCTHPEAIVEVPGLSSGPAGGFRRHTATFGCCYWEAKKP